jgi:hypothetical protein
MQMTVYLKTPPAPTPDQLAEIDCLAASVQSMRKSAEESFQRSDTDGFLSQWALGLSASRDRRQMEILRNGGHVRVRVLCDADGNVVSSHTRMFPAFNAPWLTRRVWDLGRESRDCGERRWVPVGERSRVQKQMGLHEEFRWVPGYAKITAPIGARGLGGCDSAYVGEFRSDTHQETY